jgi:hypothetical protein
VHQQKTSGHLSLIQSLGAFAQSQKATLSFVMSIRLSVLLSACIKQREWIFMKFGMRILKNLSENSNIIKT